MAREGSGGLLKAGCGVIGLFSLLCLGCAGGVAAGVLTWTRSLPVYQDALAIAADDPDVGLALGRPVSDGWMVWGTVVTSDDSGTADLSIPLDGPLGSGRLELVAVRSGADWTYQELRVEVSGSDEVIDLLRQINEAKEAAAAADAWRDIAAGDELAGQGRQEEAIVAYDRALVVDPDNIDALFRRGKACYELGRMVEAETDLRAVVTQEAQHVGAHQRLAAIATQTERWHDCIGAWTAVLQVESENADAWYGRAVCYRRQGDIARARAGAREACSRGSSPGCEMLQGMGK